MATNYRKNYIDENQKQTDKIIAERQKAAADTSNKYIKDLGAIIDENAAYSVNKIQGEIDKLPASYQYAFDANAIQQKINERQTAERMANLGLTNSGLNRTQLTAFAVQRSNADAALRQQVNSATNSLKQQIADVYAEAASKKSEIAADEKNKLAQTNQSIYNTLYDNLYSNADAYANTMYENEALIEKAKIEAATKEAERLASLEKARIDADAKIKEAELKNKKHLTAEIYDEAYDLYDASNETAFERYIEKLSNLGYDESEIDALITFTLKNKNATSNTRAWQGPIYQPNTLSNYQQLYPMLPVIK